MCTKREYEERVFYLNVGSRFFIYQLDSCDVAVAAVYASHGMFMNIRNVRLFRPLPVKRGSVDLSALRCSYSILKQSSLVSVSTIRSSSKYWRRHRGGQSVGG